MNFDMDEDIERHDRYRNSHQHPAYGNHHYSEVRYTTTMLHLSPHLSLGKSHQTTNSTEPGVDSNTGTNSDQKARPFFYRNPVIIKKSTQSSEASAPEPHWFIIFVFAKDAVRNNGISMIHQTFNSLSRDFHVTLSRRDELGTSPHPTPYYC